MENFLTLKLSQLESFRALKLSRLENFLTLKYKTLKESFRALKLSWLENFRAIKLSILVRSNYKRKKSKVLLKCHIVKSLTGGSKKLQQVTSFAGTKEELLAVNRCFLAETDGLWPRIRQLHKHMHALTFVHRMTHSSVKWFWMKNRQRPSN